MSLTFKLKMVFSVLFFFKPASWHLLLYQYRSIHFDTHISKQHSPIKSCSMCPFYTLSTCPSKGLCTALPGDLKCVYFLNVKILYMLGYVIVLIGLLFNTLPFIFIPLRYFCSLFQCKHAMDVFECCALVSGLSSFLRMIGYIILKHCAQV